MLAALRTQLSSFRECLVKAKLSFKDDRALNTFRHNCKFVFHHSNVSKVFFKSVLGITHVLPASMILVTMSELFCLNPFDSLFFSIVLFLLQIRTLLLSCYSRSYCPSCLGGNLFMSLYSWILLEAWKSKTRCLVLLHTIRSTFELEC